MMGAPQHPNARDVALEAQRMAARASERLDAHEDACGQRYMAMERRFDAMEEKRDQQHRENQAAIAEMRREGGEGRARMHAKVDAHADETRDAIRAVVEAAASKELEAERVKVKALLWAIGTVGTAAGGLAGLILKLKGIV